MVHSVERVQGANIAQNSERLLSWAGVVESPWVARRALMAENAIYSDRLAEHTMETAWQRALRARSQAEVMAFPAIRSE